MRERENAPTHVHRAHRDPRALQTPHRVFRVLPILVLLAMACGLITAACPASAGDLQELYFVGNVSELRTYYDLSNNVVRRELWLASVTPTGLKVFQFRCTPEQTVCDRYQDLGATDLLSTCSSITGTGGSNDSLTYSGLRCTSGYGRCREIVGQADRLDDGRIIFNLDINLPVSGCSAK